MRVKRRIFSGAVCEQEVYTVPDRLKNIRNAEPKVRFENEAEREEHRRGISRRLFIRKVNHNFTPVSLYSTLTMDNTHEVHTFDDARRLFGNFIKRLQYINPDVQIMAVMGRGKGTSRIHFHMLTENVSALAIRNRWVEGEVVRIEHLRENNIYNGIDHGRDYTGLATYLFDHWTPDQGKRKYRETRSTIEIPKPDTEETNKKHYLKKPPSVPKGYKVVEARAGQYGYLYFKAVKQTKPTNRKTIPKRM
jgi:hypothetical protein